MAPMHEKRATRRYRLNLPTIINWVDGGNRTCGGFTRDISAEGAFVSCRDQIPANTDLEIEILLPISGTAPGTTLRAKAHVVRTHSENEGIGIAVKGQFGQANPSGELKGELIPD
jgi:PilZ domain-containing protein